MPTKLCLWGSKDSEDMIRQCLTACCNPQVRAVVTDEFCVTCPYRATGGIAEKLSRAIAEMKKSEYLTDYLYCPNYELAIYIGKRTFSKLEAENDTRLLVLNTPYHYRQYRFEGNNILFAPEIDKIELVIRHRYDGAVVERKEVEL